MDPACAPDLVKWRGHGEGAGKEDGRPAVAYGKAGTTRRWVWTPLELGAGDARARGGQRKRTLLHPHTAVKQWAAGGSLPEKTGHAEKKQEDKNKPYRHINRNAHARIVHSLLPRITRVKTFNRHAPEKTPKKGEKPIPTRCRVLLIRDRLGAV